MIHEIGIERFSGIGSDSTGNTKWAREGTEAEVPTLLIVPDPCHHLSNTVKDITKLTYFIDVRSCVCNLLVYSFNPGDLEKAGNYNILLPLHILGNPPQSLAGHPQHKSWAREDRKNSLRHNVLGWIRANAKPPSHCRPHCDGRHQYRRL